MSLCCVVLIENYAWLYICCFVQSQCSNSGRVVVPCLCQRKHFCHASTYYSNNSMHPLTPHTHSHTTHTQNEETKKPSTYSHTKRPLYMMQVTYNCAFFVARKPYQDSQQTNDSIHNHRDDEQFSEPHLQTVGFVVACTKQCL